MGHYRYVRHAIPCVLGLLCLFWGTLLHGASQEEAMSKLAQARENLRVSEATEARIASQLARLKESGNASPDVLADYETYLDRVRGMVRENRRILQDMQAALKRHGSGGTVAGAPDDAKGGKLPEGKIPEAEMKDEVAALDAEFHASLAAFDEMLLKELDEIRSRSAGRMRDLAEEAAAAAQRVRKKGIAVDTSSRQGSGKAGSEGAYSEQERSQRAGQAESGSQRAEARGGQAEDRTAAQGTGYDREYDTEYDRSPGDGKGGIAPSRQRPASYDDDIVARQIREAAEKETDPELKERLWKEYENYKRGGSR